jgi:hypothetical protein
VGGEEWSTEGIPREISMNLEQKNPNALPRNSRKRRWEDSSRREKEKETQLHKKKKKRSNLWKGDNSFNLRLKFR